MKKILLSAGFIWAVCIVNASTPEIWKIMFNDSVKTGRDSVFIGEGGDTTAIFIDDEDIVIRGNNSSDSFRIKSNDTTKIRLGNKSISIIRDGDETYIKVLELKNEKNKDFDFELEDNDFNVHKPKKNKKDSKFEPHWAGIEFGLNNYGHQPFTTEIADADNFMELNTGKSWNFNINLFEYGFGIIRNYVGLVTGLGFEFNNYRFDRANNIKEDSMGIIVPDYLPVNTKYEKNKLATTYLTVPLLLEFQLPVGHNSKDRIYMSAGVIGGLKLGARTRVISSRDDMKTKGDFNLSPFRYGLTARVGYRSLNIFANQYLTPLFENKKGPELYPFTIGLVLDM